MILSDAIRPPTPHLEFDLSPLHELVGRMDPPTSIADLAPMTGGASTRRYFRAKLGHGGSAIAMFVPEGATPEEIQKSHHGSRWPFLEVRDLLAERGVEVPRIFAEDTARGWLVLEDLGDDTLANYLLKRPNEKRALYTRAVTDLARAQSALSSLPAHSIIASRAFDEDLLKWEIDHFREWGLDARGKSLSDADRTAFDRIRDHLAHRIAGWTRGFTHRDYQSRNLMVRESSDGAHLAWIDFQDALLGPRVYDLVALLNDSYQEFDRAFVEARLDEYASAAGYDANEREAIGREFDLVTVQRKLKDAGRFIFIDRKKNNASFLRFVTPTIRKVMSALDHVAPHEEEMRELAAILRRTLPGET